LAIRTVAHYNLANPLFIKETGTELLLENLEGRDNSEDIGVDGKIIEGILRV